MPTTHINMPYPSNIEGSVFDATVYFRNSSDAAATPTTVHYRVDCLATGKEVTDWTSVTPGTSVTITLSTTHNAIEDKANMVEKKQLVVMSDKDLSTQTRDQAIWRVRNIENI